jgi:hypothetical protein
MKFDIRRRYGSTSSPRTAFFICHTEFVVVERSIWGGVVNKDFIPVTDVIFVLFLPTPQILQSPSVTSERHCRGTPYIGIYFNT